MPKVLYVEPGDEIAELINRVRSVTDSDEVALVVPPEARLLQTPVNLRLLKQFAQSTGRTTAIVSADPRTQQLATTSGFATYASVQAYERGIELVRPHSDDEDGDDALPGGGAAAGAGMATATRVAVAPPPGITRVQNAPATVPAASTGRMGGLPRKDSRRRNTMLVIGAGVIGLVLLLVVVPAATVTITLAANPISVNSTILGSTDSSQAGRPDSLVTAVVSDDQTAQFEATPTGSQTIPAVASTGTVSIGSDLPYFASVDVPKGEEFDTADTPPVRFYTTQDTKICIPGTGAPCPTDLSAGGPDLIQVVDGTPEARGNVSAGAIRAWPQNPCSPQPNTYNCAPSDLQVANSLPTGGGTDAKRIVVASAQDVQTMTGQSNDLQTQLTAKVLQDMNAKAGSRVAAQDPSDSGRTIACTVTPPLPKPNDPFSATSITVACQGQEAAYNPRDATDIVTQDLQAKVPQGDQLSADCQIPPPIVTLASDDGRVILSASGNCFAQPVIDANGLRDQFTGMSADSVNRLTKTRVGAQVVDVGVDQHPYGLPWLPLFSSRIDVVVKVVPKTNGST